jgi:hypothetical protein
MWLFGQESKAYPSWPSNPWPITVPNVAEVKPVTCGLFECGIRGSL